MSVKHGTLVGWGWGDKGKVENLEKKKHNINT